MLDENKKYWQCPICSDYFELGNSKKEHIELEVKETKKALKILEDLK